MLGGSQETDETDTEDTEETDKETETEDKESQPQQSQLTISQGWLRMIERVSDLTKINWSDI